MIYEISSGNGPTECELAVTKFTDFLAKEYGAKTISTSSGYNKDTYRTVSVECETNLSEFTGSILWICKSPYRPNHKRKNWFINFKEKSKITNIEFDEDLVIFSTMRSGGHGGQNVNKVETAVRAVYPPTGDVTVSTEERSQYANKKKALSRLRAMVENQTIKTNNKEADKMRIAHVNLQRGNSSAVFEGERFKRIK